MESLRDTAALAALGAGYSFVQAKLASPWMDEIFHVPQTQQYCAGNWTHWDTKITTPPGLYLLGWALAQLRGSCDTATLRLVNVFGLAIGSWAVARLLRNPVFCYLLTFPLLYFFALLYYTDVWSTLLVLMGLGLTLRKWHWTSALLFTASLLFRQTNIIWAGFAAVCALMDLDVNLARLDARSGLDSLFYQAKGALENLPSTVALPYATTAGVFAAFLYLNGGITMGDKENHQVSINVPQVLYFCLFATFFSAPLLFSKTKWIQSYIWSRLAIRGAFRYITECVLIFLVATRFKVVHPFILADNRHYTFYLWRRVLDRADGLSALLVPVYHVCISWLLEAPFCLHTLFFWLGLTAVLVPSPLLEPRYYMVGFLVWRLFIAKSSITRWELIWNSIISVATLYVFCESKVHFMW